MATQLTPEFIRDAISKAAGEFGDQVLCDMCRTNPNHKQDQILIGKIWLIGRTYAAAIERQKTTEGTLGDAFYEIVVATEICESEMAM